jgi:hypothetical protein
VIANEGVALFSWAGCGSALQPIHATLNIEKNRAARRILLA